MLSEPEVCCLYERGALGHFLEPLGADVGAGGAEAAEDVAQRVVHVAAVRHLHRLPLRRSTASKKFNSQHSKLPLTSFPRYASSLL